MRKRLGLALLVLPLLAVPARAHYLPFGCYNPFKCQGCWDSCGCTFFGPWYNYWPLEAHFQTPAMPAYPFWGPQMVQACDAGAMGTCPVGAGYAPAMSWGAAAAAPAAVAPFGQPGSVMDPVGYRVGGSSSSRTQGLWLGR
jgi:hypothetical protein